MLRVAALVSGSGILSALLVSQRRVHASSKKEDGKKSWDFNWDRMGHSSATNPHAPEGESPSVVKPSATRTLILIRHGQYEHGQDDPDKRILTALGREQAMMTGERLREMGEKYTTLHYSTMPRATETANIISKSLPDVPTKSCDMLREGAPIRPEPPHSTWKPEEYVSIYTNQCCLRVMRLPLYLCPLRSFFVMEPGLRQHFVSTSIVPHPLRRPAALKSSCAMQMSFATSYAGRQ